MRTLRFVVFYVGGYLVARELGFVAVVFAIATVWFYDRGWASLCLRWFNDPERHGLGWSLSLLWLLVHPAMGTLDAVYGVPWQVHGAVMASYLMFWLALGRELSSGRRAKWWTVGVLAFVPVLLAPLLVWSLVMRRK